MHIFRTMTVVSIVCVLLISSVDARGHSAKRRRRTIRTQPHAAKRVVKVSQLYLGENVDRLETDGGFATIVVRLCNAQEHEWNSGSVSALLSRLEEEIIDQPFLEPLRIESDSVLNSEADPMREKLVRELRRLVLNFVLLVSTNGELKSKNSSTFNADYAIGFAELVNREVDEFDIDAFLEWFDNLDADEQEVFVNRQWGITYDRIAKRVASCKDAKGAHKMYETILDSLENHGLTQYMDLVKPLGKVDEEFNTKELLPWKLLERLDMRN